MKDNEIKVQEGRVYVHKFFTILYFLYQFIVIIKKVKGIQNGQMVTFTLLQAAAILDAILNI